MTPSRDRQQALALVVIRVIALWVLAGALFKLLAGTPADLPSVLRDLPLALGLQYKLAISIELAVVALAVFAPRWAWPLQAGMLATFCTILVLLWMRGDANCGCFGSGITFPPTAMLAIDAGLLASLLASRPWRLPARTGAGMGRLAAAGIAALFGIAAPWALDREAQAPAALEASVAPAAALPAYAVLTPVEWIGQPIGETSIGRWLDLGAFPETALVVIYRMTCEHCAEHLFEIAAADDGARPIVLVRIIDAGEDPAAYVVDLKPEGPHVSEITLPPSVTWVITTPAEFEVEGGVVTSAREGF